MVEIAADILLDGKLHASKRAIARLVPGELIVRKSARLPQRIMAGVAAD